MDAAKLRFEAKLQRWPLISNDIPQSEQLYIREYCPIFASNNSSHYHSPCQDECLSESHAVRYFILNLCTASRIKAMALQNSIWQSLMFQH